MRLSIEVSLADSCVPTLLTIRIVTKRPEWSTSHPAHDPKEEKKAPNDLEDDTDSEHLRKYNYGIKVAQATQER